MGILAEFIHVVTDGKRFQNPLTMDIGVHRFKSQICVASP